MANEHSQIVPSMQPTAKVADFKFWCQKVLPLVYDDSLSYYEVLNKMVVYLNQVIDNINADIDNVAELEDDFILLQEYVNNFFDDIDQLATYAERAEAAETAALSSAASAAESATNAASSAVNAATSSGSAATSALSAMDAKDAAVAAKTAAEAALASAQTAATNAANSATAASGSATNAAASATAAQNSFTLADAARSAAQSAASSAESDAADAADSADEALAALDTISNSIGNIAKTIENVGIAHVDDALASIPKKLAVDIVPVQSGSGDPSPENVRPITGWTGANLYAKGKNLAFLSDDNMASHQQETHTYANNGVVVTGTASYGRCGYSIPIKKGVTYTVSLKVKKGEAGVVGVYFNDTASWEYNYYVIGYDVAQTLTERSFSFTAVSDILFIGVYAGQGVLTVEDVQVEVGTTKTDFATYTGTTIPVTFPDAAGTVYGGTLDVTNGVLTVTHTEVDLTTGMTGGTAGQDAYVWFKALANAKTVPNSQIAPIISEYYKPIRYNGVIEAKNTIAIRDNGNVYVNNGSNTNSPEGKAIYELATPLTYTLTPTEVATLLGVNNVWADTGNINTLEYFTNAENYVTSQIDLAKALIAPVLKEMKADTALVANDFRIVGNTLYRITGNIASGGTLTPNTNCVATTVGEILKSLLSA